MIATFKLHKNFASTRRPDMTNPLLEITIDQPNETAAIEMIQDILTTIKNRIEANKAALVRSALSEDDEEDED